MNSNIDANIIVQLYLLYLSHLTSKKITMHVMSSTTLSSLRHRLKEARTRFSAAPSAFFYKYKG